MFASLFLFKGSRPPRISLTFASRPQRRFRKLPAAATNRLAGVFAAGALLALLTGALGPAEAFAQTGSAPPEIQFQKSLGGSGEDRGWSIQQTADGGFVAIGESKSNDGDVSENHGHEDMWL
jgi:hypothetical protein